MDSIKNTENQKRFVKAKKAQGLKRVILWARPEDVDALKTIARQPHAITKLSKIVEAELLRELRPKITERVKGELLRKTRRSLLVQKRAIAQRQTAGSNAPPEAIRFSKRPPRAIRNALKAGGWLFDPVAVVWHLPNDPASWPEVQQLLDHLEEFGIIKLTIPDDEKFLEG
jgi:hypothetical protein